MVWESAVIALTPSAASRGGEDMHVESFPSSGMAISSNDMPFLVEQHDQVHMIEIAIIVLACIDLILPRQIRRTLLAVAALAYAGQCRLCRPRPKR